MLTVILNEFLFPYIQVNIFISHIIVNVIVRKAEGIDKQLNC